MGGNRDNHVAETMTLKRKVSLESAKTFVSRGKERGNGECPLVIAVLVARSSGPSS